ncbi:hypothetical protein UlMin_030720 [Ulmus minor]
MARGSGNNNGGRGGQGEVVSTDDSSSPFFLNNGDHPGLNLISYPLTGNNYHTWRRAMTMALTAKNKIGFVDGTIPKPTPNDLLFSIWCRYLHDRFNQGNGPRVFQIKKQLSSLTQGSLDINAYFTQLKILWDELKEFQPVPVCQCGGLRIWSEHQQKEYVMQFLMGLNESYTQIRAQVLMMDPFPSINHVFSLVIQE